MRRGYRVQHFLRECRNCHNGDAIKEPVVKRFAGDPPVTIDTGAKQKVEICRLDHLPVEPSGICSAWRTPERRKP